MNFEDLKPGTILLNEFKKWTVLYHCVCKDPNNPEFTLKDADEEQKIISLNLLNEEKWIIQKKE